MQHKKITGSDVHVLHAYTYADETTRLAATGFTAEDVGKAALQESDNTLWALTDHSPITWLQIGTGAPPGPHTHAESDITGLTADLANKSNVGHTHAEADITGLTADLANKSNVGHSHVTSDVTGLDTALAGKSDTGHIHDDRYYTETEVDTLLSNKAPLASPALTGIPTAPTAAPGTNSTQLATTAFVAAAVAAGGGGSGGGSSSSTVSMRQTVLSGSVDSNGFPNFLSAGTGLSVNVAATAVPIKISFGDGSTTETISADAAGAFSGLTASTTNYLYRENGVSYGASLLLPLYQAYAPSSPATDQHWYDTSRDTMYRWNGSAWETKVRVFVGEAVTGASSVSSVTAYALQGRYSSGRFAIANATTYTKNHNLGVEPRTITAMGAKAAGGALAHFFGYYNSTNGWESTMVQGVDRNTYSLVTGTYSFISDGTGPAYRAQAVEARVVVDRGW